MTIEQIRGRNVPPTGPYDTLRDYLAALNARGRLLHIERMDQDAFEGTGFAYRLIDEFGINKAPTFVIDEIKIDGKWIKGPVVCNLFGGWDMEAMGLGVEEITDDYEQMYRAAIDKLISMTDENGKWQRIKPINVKKEKAPCKEVILTGDDVDITSFPFLQCNPADGGRYINSGSMIFQDRELGRNVGTYRCHIKSARKVMINPEVGQHGWNFLMQAKKRGEATVNVAVVLGLDPITYTLSSTKLATMGEDEFELAGGLKGKPIELVPCETSDIMVPADAEMVIEGEVPLDEQDDEGPHGEMFGYLGGKHDANFFMNIKAITHRKDRILVNNFPGAMRGFYTSLPEAHAFLTYKKLIYNLVGYHSPAHLTGVTVVSIDKNLATEGISAGQHVAAHNRFSKITIVVDKDINIYNFEEVMHAVATRWQPYPASLIIPRARGPLLDPSAATRGIISKIIIDATRQFPEEGGPKEFAAASRTLLSEMAPNVFDLVESNWSSYWKHWQK